MKRLWIVFALASAATAQPSGPKLVTNAAGALGGKERILAIKTLVIEGSGVAPNLGQNPFPEGPLPTWWVPDFKRTLDLANGRMRTEQHRIAMFPFALATDLRQIQALDGDVAFNFTADGRALRAGEAAVADRRLEMLGTPVTVLRAALGPGAKLGAARKKGNDESVDVTTAKGDKLTLVVDGTTHLPKSVSWMSASENLGDVVNTTTFEDYENVSGVQMPRHYITKIDFRNWTSGDFRVSKNTVDGSAGDLAAPAEVKSAAVPPPPAISVEVQQVGKGIWWLAGNGNAFSILFEFDDHLTLFEAPTSEARTKAVIDKARSLVPNKPLTEVIVTHHHFDHTGGLRTAVAEGLTVIAHQGNEGIFREVTSRKATLKPDLLSRSGKTLKFRGMDDTLVLKDSSMEVRLFRLIDNTHCPYLIAAYVPRDNLLVQGDLIDMGWTQHPWAENYRRNLALRNIHFTRDIPVHGRIATFDEEMAALAEMEKHTK